MDKRRKQNLLVVAMIVIVATTIFTAVMLWKWNLTFLTAQ
jgi:hypothetical protein